MGHSWEFLVGDPHRGICKEFIHHSIEENNPSHHQRTPTHIINVS